MDRYFRCGEQDRRIEAGDRIPPGIALVKGRVGHRVAAHNWRAKQESGADVDLNKLLDVARTALREETADGVMLTPDEAFSGQKRTIERTADRLAQVTVCFHEELAPSIQPVLVEQKIEVELPELDLELVGVLDLSDQSDYVRDLKIAGRKKRHAEAHGSDQLTMYDYLFEAHTGRRPQGLVMDVIHETKDAVGLQHLPTERQEADRQVLARKVQAFTAGIKAGLALPAAPGSWICSPTYCGYWWTCPYVNSERIAAAEEK